jgi:hypothetical protein
VYCGVASLLFSLAALLGWVIGWHRFLAFGIGATAIQPRTAICFVLLSATLLAKLSGSSRIGNILLTIASLLILSSPMQAITGIGWDFEQALTDAHWISASPAGVRLTRPATTIFLTLLAIGLGPETATGRLSARLGLWSATAGAFGCGSACKKDPVSGVIGV